MFDGTFKWTDQEEMMRLLSVKRHPMSNIDHGCGQFGMDVHFPQR
jgi:hypothetical protein